MQIKILTAKSSVKVWLSKKIIGGFAKISRLCPDKKIQAKSRKASRLNPTCTKQCIALLLPPAAYNGADHRKQYQRVRPIDHGKYRRIHGKQVAGQDTQKHK